MFSLAVLEESDNPADYATNDGENEGREVKVRVNNPLDRDITDRGLVRPAHRHIPPTNKNTYSKALPDYNFSYGRLLIYKSKAVSLRDYEFVGSFVVSQLRILNDQARQKQYNCVVLAFTRYRLWVLNPGRSTCSGRCSLQRVFCLKRPYRQKGETICAHC